MTINLTWQQRAVIRANGQRAVIRANGAQWCHRGRLPNIDLDEQGRVLQAMIIRANGQREWYHRRNRRPGGDLDE